MLTQKLPDIVQINAKALELLPAWSQYLVLPSQSDICDAPIEPDFCRFRTTPGASPFWHWYYSLKRQSACLHRPLAAALAFGCIPGFGPWKGVATCSTAPVGPLAVSTFGWLDRPWLPPFLQMSIRQTSIQSQQHTS